MLYVREYGVLPIRRREIPFARPRFMIVATGTVINRRIAPVIHSHLQQCAARNSCPNPDGAAFQMPRRKLRPRRCSPKMPNPVRALPDAQNYAVMIVRIGERHGIARIG